MKSAMLLEYDTAAREETAGLLKSLGYIVANAATPQGALATAKAVRFDALLTCTDFNADDRRSLVGELARLMPGSAIVMLLDSDATGAAWHDRACSLLFKPVTLRSLRRVLEFGVDGGGMHAAMPPGDGERRRAERRQRAR